MRKNDQLCGYESAYKSKMAHPNDPHFRSSSTSSSPGLRWNLGSSLQKMSSHHKDDTMWCPQTLSFLVNNTHEYYRL